MDHRAGRHCDRIGNHLGIQPHGFKDSLEFAADEIEELTGIRIEIPIDRKGADVLLVVPSADYFGSPHYFTLLGYLMVLHETGVDYTFSAFASEGGNFGLFASHELMKRLNAKIYAEAKRLGVKWILGGECGHMWRVVHQYMGTMNGPADFLEVPVSPVTGTRFEHAASTKMVHVCEFTADLIAHGKLTLDRSRNDHWNVTFHDSCNPARGMGLYEEPRLILRHVLNHFHEMAEDTIREQTLCCGSGAGLGHRRELRDAHARRPPARDGGARRAGAPRHQLPGVHLRHRQGDAAAAARVLGARRRGRRRPRTGGQRPRDEGREGADDRCAGRAAGGPGRRPMRDRGWILGAFALLVALALWPVWRAAGIRAAKAAGPAAAGRRHARASNRWSSCGRRTCACSRRGATGWCATACAPTRTATGAS